MFNGNKIRKSREKMGISMESLVMLLHDEKLNISRQTLWCWEKGLTVPNANCLCIIAHVLGVPISYFFDKKNN